MRASGRRAFASSFLLKCDRRPQSSLNDLACCAARRSQCGRYSHFMTLCAIFCFEIFTYNRWRVLLPRSTALSTAATTPRSPKICSCSLAFLAFKPTAARHRTYSGECFCCGARLVVALARRLTSRVARIECRRRVERASRLPNDGIFDGGRQIFYYTRAG